MSRKWIVGAVTVALVGCSGMTLQAVRVEAQTKPADPMKKDQSDTMMKKPGTMKGTEITGQVQDVKGEQVTLADGTVLTVPKTQAKNAEIKAGNKIKATYEEQGGKKVVTSLQIMAGPQTK